MKAIEPILSLDNLLIIRRSFSKYFSAGFSFLKRFGNQRFGNQRNSGIILPFLLLAVLSTSSCQTITKFKCNNKNWSEVGQSDGKSGKLADVSFDAHNSECVAAGTQIDQSVYMQGYKAGLAEFCVYDSGMSQALDGMINNGLCSVEFGADFDNGFGDGLSSLCTAEGGRRLGSNGKSYRDTCSQNAKADFLNGYVNGLNSYIPATETKLGALQSQLTTVDTSLARVQADISAYDIAIKTAKTNKNEALAKELGSSKSPLTLRQTTLNTEKRSLTTQIASAKKRLTIARSMLVKWGGT